MKFETLVFLCALLFLHTIDCHAQRKLIVHASPPKAMGKLGLGHEYMWHSFDTSFQVNMKSTLMDIDSITQKSTSIIPDEPELLTARIVYYKKILFIHKPIIIAYKQGIFLYKGKYYPIDSISEEFFLKEIRNRKKYWWLKKK